VAAASLSIRSLLFAPGNEERKLRKLLDGDASLAVADLEDGVPEGDKAAGRALVAEILAAVPPAPGSPRRCVRINALDTEHAEADLAAVARLDLDAVMVPKAEAEGLEGLSGRGLPPIVAIVETPTGLQDSARIARAPGVAALLLGGVDLARSLRLGVRADGLDLLYARSRVVIDSAAAGIAPPIDGVYTAIDDLDGLRAEAALVRSLGFGGKSCIHPSHVAVIEEVFRPAEEELAWARRVVAAYEEAAGTGTGAIRVDGAMVDLPVVDRARDLLAAEARV
jgi:citrate lyase beta subunit